MSVIHLPETEKSTNVRSFSRFAARIGRRLAAEWSARRTLRQLATPQLREPSGLPRVPQALTFHRQIASGKFQLAAWEWGHGPAVLLVHDWNGQARDLEELVPRLLEAGYRVIAADMPAHGRSSGQRASLEDWRRAVQSLARHAGPVEGVIAHGLGATAAAWAAEGIRPRKLVLLAPRADLAGDLRRHALELGVDPRDAAPLLERLEARLGIPLAALEMRRLVPRLNVPAVLTLGPAGSETRLAAGQPAVAHLALVDGSATGTPFPRQAAVVAQTLAFLLPRAAEEWSEPVAPEYSLAM